MVTDKGQVIENLDELIPIFYECILSGFNDYYRRNEGDTFNFRPTTRANMIYDYIISYLKKGLVNDSRVAFLNKNGLLTLMISDKYLIKFKKLNDNHKSSNVKTKQNTLFLKQETLFDLPPSVTNIEIGYVLNKINSDIDGVFIVCPKNERENAWEIDLDEHLQAKSNLTLFNTKKPSKQIDKKRFKIKKEKSDGDSRKEKAS